MNTLLVKTDTETFIEVTSKKNGVVVTDHNEEFRVGLSILLAEFDEDLYFTGRYIKREIIDILTEPTNQNIALHLKKPKVAWWKKLGHLFFGAFARQTGNVCKMKGIMLKDSSPKVGLDKIKFDVFLIKQTSLSLDKDNRTVLLGENVKVGLITFDRSEILDSSLLRVEI